MPQNLDICEVLCLNKYGWPLESCKNTDADDSHEECVRKHLNHVMAIRGALHQMDINTISNFLLEDTQVFLSRLKEMLERSHGNCSWQCCPSSPTTSPKFISGDAQVGQFERS